MGNTGMESGPDYSTKRKYLNQTVHGGLRDAQSHLNKMRGERDRDRNLDSLKQTLNQYLDRWLEVCAKPRLRAKSLQRQSPSPHGRTRMIVFPLTRSVGLKAATASSRRSEEHT